MACMRADAGGHCIRLCGVQVWLLLRAVGQRRGPGEALLHLAWCLLREVRVAARPASHVRVTLRRRRRRHILWM